VLTHADLKAPVEKTLDEICKNPQPGTWQKRMRDKIEIDNKRLINFIHDNILEIK